MKKKLKLMIIDDDADDRNIFIEAVRDVDQNIECIEIDNGEKALQILGDRSSILPDCIFLDLRMPRVSGKKCLEEIKRNERLRHIPVFIYTTSREEAESRELKDIGAFHFISKPNSEEEVYYLIAFALEEQFNLPGKK